MIEKGAGEGSGFPDSGVHRGRSQDRPDADTVWQKPNDHEGQGTIKPEWPRMKKGQVVFTYFHFAADKELTLPISRAADLYRLRNGGAAESRAAALTPMSEVADELVCRKGQVPGELHGGRGCSSGRRAPAGVVILGGASSA